MATTEYSLPMASASSAHVLLVDHDRDDRLSFVRTLTADGFKVTEAHNGLQAFQKAIDGPTDLVVTGTAIPGIDGFELCRRLRHTAVTSHIPIITITGASTSLDEGERARQAGSDVVLARPCDPKDLLDEIHRLLARAHELSRRAIRVLKEVETTQRFAASVREHARVEHSHSRRLLERASTLRQLRTDFSNIPGLRLTPQEGARLWNLEVNSCAYFLDRLVTEGFLVRTRDGRFKRRDSSTR